MRRLGPIFAVADIGYAFQDQMATAKAYEKKFNIKSEQIKHYYRSGHALCILCAFSVTNQTKYGVHGYDNQEPDMNAIFMAKGMLFSKGKSLKSVNMIDLYNLMCLILNIDCDENDGSKNLDMYDDLFAVKPIRATQKGKHRLSGLI